ncbi:unnamed protein product [Durusdinium trenchii]|uniref:Uncharacterized protein n=1 Tax=Durusdinium trenchii TaxID=1381693 RepID=A0ABP0SX98_9DINO
MEDSELQLVRRPSETLWVESSHCEFTKEGNWKRKGGGGGDRCIAETVFMVMYAEDNGEILTALAGVSAGGHTSHADVSWGQHMEAAVVARARMFPETACRKGGRRFLKFQSANSRALRFQFVECETGAMDCACLKGLRKLADSVGCGNALVPPPPPPPLPFEGHTSSSSKPPPLVPPNQCCTAIGPGAPSGLCRIGLQGDLLVLGSKDTGRVLCARLLAGATITVHGHDICISGKSIAPLRLQAHCFIGFGPSDGRGNSMMPPTFGANERH